LNTPDSVRPAAQHFQFFYGTWLQGESRGWCFRASKPSVSGCGQLDAMGKARSTPTSQAAKTTAVAETPVDLYNMQLYLDSVWTQRTIEFQGRKGMVIEVNLSHLIPGLPRKGESFTVSSAQRTCVHHGRKRPSVNCIHVLLCLACGSLVACSCGPPTPHPPPPPPPYPLLRPTPAPHAHMH
jgi:hypothetical protein